MSDRILVLQQVPHEGLGTLYSAIRRAGTAEEVIPTYAGAEIPTDLSAYSGLIIMGGPMSVHDADTDPVLAAEQRLVEEAIAQDFPTLGIFLGAQLIARAAGARVYRGNTPEIGWFEVHPSMESADDPLFADLPSPLPVFQWHGEGFDLPEGAVHLASSPAFPHQAFRLGSHVYGLQFHLEMEDHMIKEWMEANSGDLEAAKGHVDLDDLVRDSAARWLALAAARRR